MRTTLTLDDDLARELKDLARVSDRSFKEVVNQTLRKGLSVGDKPATDLPPFEVKPHSSAFRPGIDLEKLNQLYDQLEMEDFQEELAEAQLRDRRR